MLMLKNIFIIIFFLFCSFNLFSQNGDKKIYDDLGEWIVEIDNYNKISLSAYITKNEIEIDKKYDVFTKNKLYEYKLYLKSNTKYNNELVSIWIHHAKIYVNGFEITKEKFPNGFLIHIKSKPTLVYQYRSIYKNIDLYIEWDKILIE